MAGARIAILLSNKTSTGRSLLQGDGSEAAAIIESRVSDACTLQLQKMCMLGMWAVMVSEGYKENTKMPPERKRAPLSNTSMSRNGVTIAPLPIRVGTFSFVHYLKQVQYISVAYV